ncbi:hypothetical protein T310_5766 [Rasamsonia emersonii CBS 393.64]|uniref:DUF541 domain-containing protein n=1 Tax=Rasamsonia emersonii (strain ATCC 16479 / CBS 393.64 / IMI 116815) TaxID=1408163 RepID=A0A0F4YPL0_RASE3|nr:hypothetical protein T310_5766 [Rasamsonia emersonii CBS 393.64]KKA20197.1 hypothetical protein T310_5766 [Rasamsonia emersonii CBS 393.64]
MAPLEIKVIVSQQVTSTSNQLQQLLKGLSKKTETGAVAPDAAVTVFTVGSMRSNSHVPYDYGTRKPGQRQYEVSIKIEALFRDFDKFGQICSQLVSTPYVEIASINWRLTDETRKALESEARKLSLLDAIEQARDYSEIVGRQVVPVEISSMGLHRHSHQPVVQQMAQDRASVGNEFSGTGLALESESVSVTGTVNVTFRAE